MGIYIFNWKTLKRALMAMAEQPALDFGKHVIPYSLGTGMTAMVTSALFSLWKSNISS